MGGYFMGSILWGVYYGGGIFWGVYYGEYIVGRHIMGCIFPSLIIRSSCITGSAGTGP